MSVVKISAVALKSPLTIAGTFHQVGGNAPCLYTANQVPASPCYNHPSRTTVAEGDLHWQGCYEGQPPKTATIRLVNCAPA